MIKIYLQEDEFFLDSIKSGRVISAGFYLKASDNYFPALGWNDNPVVVLGWFINQTVKLKTKKKVSCPFMEGPFYFEISMLKGEELAFDFYIRGKDDTRSVACPGVTTTLPLWVAELRDTASKLLQKNTRENG